MNQELKDFLEKNTSLSEVEISEAMKYIPLESYKKGTILQVQGEITEKCYFILNGCIRQYSVGEDGRETTYHFFTEGQSVVLFQSYKQKLPSDYFLTCLEDCLLITGSRESEEMMYKLFPDMLSITRDFMEEDFGQAQEDMNARMGGSPEERYLKFLEKRPELASRVPQHQLASYLGITPESLSRIKKRISQ